MGKLLPARVWAWGRRYLVQFRPWPEFFKRGDISPPRSLPRATHRVTTNLVYYQANYLAILSLCLLYGIIAKPRFLVGLLIAVGVGVYLFQVRRAPIVVSNRVVPRRQLAMGYSVFVPLVFLLFGGRTGLMALLMGIVLVSIHAVLRVASLKARGTTYVSGGLGASPLGTFVKALSGEQEEEEEEVDEEAPVKRRIPAATSEQSQFFETDAQRKANEEHAKARRAQKRVELRAKYALGGKGADAAVAPAPAASGAVKDKDS